MRLASCFCLLLFSMQLNAQANASATDFSVTLERIGCLDLCPWYSVTILGDGAVRYEGKAYVHDKGIRQKTITVSDVNKLIQKLRDEDFFDWEEKTLFCPDNPRVLITASLNGKHQQVEEGCSVPGKVLTLAEDIDTISGTKSWVGNVLEEMIQKQCHAPQDPIDNQPMPEQFEIPDAPQTARKVSCFASFKKGSTMLDVVKKCGIPDQHAGSGIYIFVYYMSDCSTVAVGTPDLKRIGITHVKHGKSSVLLGN